MLCFSESSKLASYSVSDGFDFNVFSQKAVLSTKSVKISDCWVQRGKTLLPTSPYLWLECSFRLRNVCMFKQGCHGAVGHEVANPTPELEMSSARGTDYGKHNLPRSPRREAEWNVLIRRGRAPLQGALG